MLIAMGVLVLSGELFRLTATMCRRLTDVRRLPLWLRWVLTLLIFGALAVAVLTAIQSSGGSGDSLQREAAALIRANRATRMLVIKDQAPRSSALPRGVTPQRALERAIGADVRNRVSRNQLEGPVLGVRCISTNRERADRHRFRCTASAGGIGYPFRGVVNVRAQRLTWCKFDPVPPGQRPVPLSPRCEA